ncbi:Fic family protein [Patescibacteria group bacterium]|nr:Fic family protein [Patescibacteria group bacterium]MBU4017183.1 Fic family protein [Patescibacteria group bacterium]
MNVTISERAKKILRVLANGEALPRAAIEKSINETRINTIRELNRLVELRYVQTSGEARATTYTITDHARIVVLWDIEEYLAEEPDKRHARYTGTEPELFKSVKGIIGTPPPAIENAAHHRRTVGDSVTARKDLERFVIELSWKSSKIEGNTYTLLDTERLIKEAQEASGHAHSEAVMILNHKRAFDYIWTHQKTFRTLTKQGIEEVHELLVKGLDVPVGLRETPVGITGTVYVPPASKVELASYLRDIIDTINNIDQPVEKAMACLVLLPYLQVFADGNKRTSRLVANAVLLAYGYPPLSYRSIDEQAYKGALILFYEQGSLANIRELYLKQLEESASSYFFPIR